MSETRSNSLRWTMAALVVVLLIGPLGGRSASALVESDRIIFSLACDDGPGGLDLGLLDPAGPTATLTNTTMDEGAGISDDGAHIAVSGYDGIRITDPDGTGPMLIPGTGQARFPAWSPDGTKIAYSHNGQLFIVGYDPYVPPISLTEPSTLGTTGLDWSPDGSTLLWSTPESKIVAVTVPGGAKTELANGTSARYSTDGTFIAFTAMPTGNIATMNPDGSDLLVSPQPGTIGGVFGQEAAFRDRHVVDDNLVDYIGTYSFATQATTTLIEGDPICDTNFYVWDWGNLKLPTFRDTAYDDLFFADIEWLATQNITKGCNPPTNDRFCPDDYVTRGQMAAFLVRAFGYTDDGDGDLFTDDNGNTFEADIDKLGTAGVTRGCNPPTNDRFCPDDLVSRGQIAAFLHRTLDN